MRHAPVATRRGPEPVRTHDELALRVELAPLVEEELDFCLFPLGQRLVCPAGVVGRRVEGLRVGEDVEQIRKVLGDNVRDEPRNGLGMEDDGRGEVCRQEVAGEDEVDEELEARVVEDDVDPPLAVLPLLARVAQHIEGSCHVVDDDVVLRSLARLRALQLLDILVREGRQKGQVRGITPQADLAHLIEEQSLRLLDLLRGLAVGAFALLRLLRELLVSVR